MSITTTIDPDAETIDPKVAAAFVKYLKALAQPFGPVMLTATIDLERAASDADVLLCEFGDLSPYDVTIRTACCGAKVCDNHEDEHDFVCVEFDAQKFEEVRR